MVQSHMRLLYSDININKFCSSISHKHKPGDKFLVTGRRALNVIPRQIEVEGDQIKIKVQ
jgi:hypothetical protein